MVALTRNKTYLLLSHKLACNFIFFGDCITCLSVDDSHWLAEAHSRNTWADYKLAASSFFETLQGKETHGLQLANSKAALMLLSIQYPQLLHSCAVIFPVVWTSEFAVQTLAEVSEWAEGILSRWEKCWQGPVLQFFKTVWNLRATYVKRKVIFGLLVFTFIWIKAEQNRNIWIMDRLL